MSHDIQVYLATYSQLKKEVPSKHLYHDTESREELAYFFVKNVASQILGVSASFIEINSSLGLKPSLSVNGCKKSLFFNLSNCKDFVICAFSKIGEVGVDFEVDRELHNLEELQSYIYNDFELERYTSGTKEKKKRVFFETWVQKESISKLLKFGLSLDFKKIKIEQGVVYINDPAISSGYCEEDIFVKKLDIGSKLFCAIAHIGKAEVKIIKMV